MSTLTHIGSTLILRTGKGLRGPNLVGRARTESKTVKVYVAFCDPAQLFLGGDGRAHGESMLVFNWKGSCWAVGPDGSEWLQIVGFIIKIQAAAVSGWKGNLGHIGSI